MYTSKEILESFMPKGLSLDKFTLTKIEKEKRVGINSDVFPHQLYYYFVENNVPPEGYTLDQLIFKGYSRETTISDLPIRDNFFGLKIKTRRWLIKGTNKELGTKISVVEKGTKNTKELSFFLKSEKDSGGMSNAQLSRVTGLKMNTISKQYMNTTSDYAKDKENGGKLYKGVSKRGYINKEFTGEILCLDEKHIKNKVYTGLSNAGLNKLLAWIPGIKANKIIRKLKKHIKKYNRDKVKEVAVDMSNGMEKIAREVFRNAKIVTDRFHVRKLFNEIVGSVKTKIKVKLSRYITKMSKKKKYKAKRYDNGETILEITTRAHYQIRRNKKDWNSNQKRRWKIMKKLQCFKGIVAIYEMSMEIYEIYEQKITKEEATKLMKNWIKKARRYRRIPELLHLADSIENRLDTITNYFISRHSNGFGEGLNSRIGRIVYDNRGFKNDDYMIFRFIKALG